MAGIHSENSNPECPPSDPWYQAHLNKLMAGVVIIVLGLVSTVGTIVLDKIESLANRADQVQQKAENLGNQLDNTQDKLGQVVDQTDEDIAALQERLRQAKLQRDQNAKRIATVNDKVENTDAKAENAQKTADNAEDKADKKNSTTPTRPTPTVVPTPRPTPTPKSGVCALGLCDKTD